MKYICLGYHQEGSWERMSEVEQKDFIDKCFVYDARLRNNGHMVGGEALQSSRTATTIRSSGLAVTVTDGPFAETKEQLGGIMILEARNLDEAIALMSKHPSVMMGTTWEIRPSNDQINEMFEKTHGAMKG